MATVFSKAETRGVPKTIRLNERQRQVLDRIVEMGVAGKTATDVILSALDVFSEKILHQTKDKTLHQLMRT